MIVGVGASAVANPVLDADFDAVPQVELVQFMGKDNVPFHTVLFPSALMGAWGLWPCFVCSMQFDAVCMCVLSLALWP